MKESIKKEIEVPEGVTVNIDGKLLSVKGTQGENQRHFSYPTISLSYENNKIFISAEKASKREKRMIGTYEAHINNMIKGVQGKFAYTLKICSGHFPMNVTVSGNELTIKNFLGEKHPRKISFPDKVSVKVNGTDVEIESCCKELAGQIAAKIEQLCRITDKDIRIFQDGLYITKKA
jgi:large subunit ribosomal protein L6